MTPLAQMVARAFVEPYASRVRALFRSLSPEQHALVASDFAPGLLNVVAAAGSGKTRDALAILVRLIAEAKLAGSSGRPLAPSFTTAARDELMRRLVDLIGDTGGVGLVTFEHLMRAVLRETGLFDGRMWTRAQEVDWLAQEVGEDLCTRLADDFSYSRLSASLRAIVDRLVRDQPLDERVGEVVIPAWERMRTRARHEGYLLEDGVGKLVLAHAAELANYLMEERSWQVSHVLVDEFQDCAPRHLAIPLVVARAIPVIGLGDRFQGIMGFQGGLGDPEPIFAREHITIVHRHLAVNFRSTVALVEAQRGLLRVLGATEFPVAAPGAATGTPPLYGIVDTEEALYDALAYGIEALGLAGMRASSRSYAAIDPDLRAALDARLRTLAGRIARDDLLVMVPSNPIGQRADELLGNRGIPAAFDGRGVNPYEGLTARLAHAWLRQGRVRDPSARLHELSIVIECFVTFDVVSQAPSSKLWRSSRSK